MGTRGRGWTPLGEGLGLCRPGDPDGWAHSAHRSCCVHRGVPYRTQVARSTPVMADAGPLRTPSLQLAC